jgi:hypothetical protein
VKKFIRQFNLGAGLRFHCLINFSWRNGSNKASAVLLSFFMMTLLVLSAIGVSFLVIRDVETVRTIVSGVQSQYAAEGMTEIGLYTVSENLPGYEPEFEDYTFSNAALASLDMDARDREVPCNGEGEWLSLSENESMQIALFAQINEGGDVDHVNDFYVEFYVGDEDGNVNYSPSLDVLRWKILGLKEIQNEMVTEAISEYIPLNPNQPSYAENPTLFGPGVVNPALTAYTKAKYYEQIGSRYVFHAFYSISNFLSGHEYNYLVLTNVVQEAGDDVIYFRLISQGQEAVCEYVTLAATGSMEFGDTRQNLETLVREGENLPVFDFVLYHTDNDGSEEEVGNRVDILGVGDEDFDFSDAIRSFGN